MKRTGHYLLWSIIMLMLSFCMTAYADEEACQHDYQPVVTEATCTEQGYTTYTAASYGMAMNQKNNGSKVYCVVTDENGKSAKTNAVTLKYKAAAPKITDQPASKAVKSGAKVSFTVKAKWATGYQWYYRTSQNGSWKKVSGAAGKTATLTVTVTRSMKGYQYRCVVKNLKGSATTRTVKLTVK